MRQRNQDQQTQGFIRSCGDGAPVGPSERAVAAHHATELKTVGQILLVPAKFEKGQIKVFADVIGEDSIAG